MIDIAILSGGSSVEKEISIFSTNELLKHLNKQKYNIKVIYIPEYASTDWIKELLENPPDLVLSGLHGGLGEDGSIQGLLECLNLRYVGSKVLSSSICMDKFISKVIMRSNHIPVVDDVFINKNENIINFEKDILELGFPLIVKPNRGGSSIGITIVNNKYEIEKAIKKIIELDDDILIEKYIKGKEVTCGVVETQKDLEVLTVLDIDTSNPFYDYDAKYYNSDTKIQFSTLPDFQKTMIKEIAKKAFKALRCSGYGRLDLLMHEEQIYVLEMNTLPGLTSHSLIPKAIEEEKVSFSDFLDRLIEFELQK